MWKRLPIEASMNCPSPQKQPAEPPSKFIRTIVEVQMACRLLFVDMEGLNDGRAVKKIAAHVNPRKMVKAFASPPHCISHWLLFIDCCPLIPRGLSVLYRCMCGRSHAYKGDLCPKCRRANTNRSTDEQLFALPIRGAPVFH